jgi:hypothetical protein
MNAFVRDLRGAAASPANDMWYPTNDERLSAGVVTEIHD